MDDSSASSGHLRFCGAELAGTPTFLYLPRVSSGTEALAYLEFNRFPEWRALLTLLVLVFCLIGFGRRRRPVHHSSFIVHHFRRLAHHRPLSLILLFCLSFTLTASLSLRRGLPLPAVHDEFSYLLAADTFANGRLTNPTPPLPEHFESMHILVRPTYASKYPPAQGLFMALGQVLSGKPIAGVWLSTALAVAAVAWLLYAFVSPPWALLGGILAAVHPQILEWGNRYWGGNVAVLGGALFLGGLARWSRATRQKAGGSRQNPEDGRHHLSFIIYRLSFPSSLATALGLLLLANSRPFEGAVFAALTLSFWLLHHLKTRPRAPFIVYRLSFIVFSSLLLAGFACMAYYNHRVTGHALRLPYQAHQSQYGTIPLFIFQSRSPEPAYSSEELRLFHTREQEYWYARHDSWPKLREEGWKNINRLWQGALGNVEPLAASLLILPWFFLRNRTIRRFSIILFLLLAILLTETFMYPHYAAPAAGMVAVLLVMLLRRLHHLGHPLGPAIARSAVAITLLWSAFWYTGFFNWIPKPDEFAARRHRIQQHLENQPGRHLILVRYGEHNVHEEWVYNDADLVNAKVVWARERDLRSNKELLHHFPHHQPWLLEPDVPAAEPVPYEPSTER